MHSLRSGDSMYATDNRQRTRRHHRTGELDSRTDRHPGCSRDYSSSGAKETGNYSQLLPGCLRLVSSPSAAWLTAHICQASQVQVFCKRRVQRRWTSTGMCMSHARVEYVLANWEEWDHLAAVEPDWTAGAAISPSQKGAQKGALAARRAFFFGADGARNRRKTEKRSRACPPD
ncbi:hypothetical protein ABW21_db0201899 [Orbilia brochopaga]|nr:hypothetical protein ABW21_db0201899 [Drechslerella brochopaga]